jgi:WD40 repeat protein
MTPEQLRETLLTYLPADERDALSAAPLPDAATLHRQLVEVWGDLHALPDEYAWRNLAYHLIEGGQTDRLYALLTDYRWLQAKLDATDSDALESDCAAYLTAVTDGETAQTIQLIQSALRMSAHVLAQDKTQLPYQLTGRLWMYRHQPALAALWRTCHTVTPLEILETQEHPPMFIAGGGLIHTMTGHRAWIRHVVQLDDGRLLSWSEDGTIRFWSADGHLLSTLSSDASGISFVL